MRLLIICPSLEPGQTGVGDYCALLAQKLGLMGVEVALFALHDCHIRELRKKTIISRGSVDFTQLRLPSSLCWKGKMKLLQDAVTEFDPDWISLHFVPYGFHRKGLPLGLARRLRGIKGRFHWHIMFHELWVGANLGSPLRHRIIGGIQRYICVNLVGELNIKEVFTSTPVGIAMLHSYGIVATRAPIFGTIQISVPPTTLPVQFSAITAERNKLVVGMLFGSIYQGWRGDNAIFGIQECCERVGKRLVIVKVGRSVAANDGFENWTQRIGSEVQVIDLGEVDALVASALIAEVDFGFVTTPLELIAKSASVSTFRSHGIPLVINRDDWSWKNKRYQDLPEGAIDCRNGVPHDLLNALRERSKFDSLDCVARKYLSLF